MSRRLSAVEVEMIAGATREAVNAVGRSNLDAQYEALRQLDIEDGPWEEPDLVAGAGTHPELPSTAWAETGDGFVANDAGTIWMVCALRRPASAMGGLLLSGEEHPVVLEGSLDMSFLSRGKEDETTAALELRAVQTREGPTLVLRLTGPFEPAMLVEVKLRGVAIPWSRYELVPGQVILAALLQFPLDGQLVEIAVRELTQR